MVVIQPHKYEIEALLWLCLILVNTLTTLGQQHQEQLPQTEYSQGNSGETNKTREKPEAIHSPTNATKQHKQ